MRAEGFFYNLDILYGGLGIGKLQFLVKKKKKKNSAVIFFQFLVIKALDPDWIRIRIGIQPQTLDPDPEKMNTDSQPWVHPAKILIFHVAVHFRTSPVLRFSMLLAPAFRIRILDAYTIAPVDPDPDSADGVSLGSNIFI